MKPVYIYGAGGLGSEILALINQLHEWRVEGFLDDHKTGSLSGVPIFETNVLLSAATSPVNLVLAIGNPIIKQQIETRLRPNINISYPVIIHPSAILLSPGTIEIGEGSIITAGCVLTTAIRIGAHVLVNLNSTIGHESVVKDYASIMPGVNLAGNVVVEEAVLIGSGANVLNGVTVGARSKVGAGAVVLDNVPADVTTVGVPAKPVRKA